jgi:hypothetical protein
MEVRLTECRLYFLFPAALQILPVPGFQASNCQENTRRQFERCGKLASGTLGPLSVHTLEIFLGYASPCLMGPLPQKSDADV